MNSSRINAYMADSRPSAPPVASPDLAPCVFARTPGIDAENGRKGAMLRAVVIMVLVLALLPVLCLLLSRPADAWPRGSHHSYRPRITSSGPVYYTVGGMHFQVIGKIPAAHIRHFRSHNRRADWPRIARRPRTSVYLKTYFTP